MNTSCEEFLAEVVKFSHIQNQNANGSFREMK